MTQERYDTPLDTRILPSGRIVYRSLLPSAIIPDPLTDVQITATDTIRMDMLAHNVYGDASMWWKIAAANGRADGSMYFKAGSRIVIPGK